MFRKRFMSERLVFLVLFVLCSFTVGATGKLAYDRFDTMAVDEFNDSLANDSFWDVPSFSALPVWDSPYTTDPFKLYSGDNAYFEEGLLHRDNGPAIIRSAGNTESWLFGCQFDADTYSYFADIAKTMGMHGPGLKLFFNGYEMIPDWSATDISTVIGDMGTGECVIANPLGSTAWIKDGKVSRDNGPAVEFINGTEWYMKDGQFHRLDGPAITWADRTENRYEYWVNGRQLTVDEFYAGCSPVTEPLSVPVSTIGSHSLQPVP